MENTHALVTTPKLDVSVPADVSAGALQSALAGDLKRLTPDDRLKFYGALCQFTGLNPLSKPFEWLELQGKLVLYANKGCAEQLRKLHKVTVEIIERRFEHGCHIVRVKATDGAGRSDEAIGAVPVMENARGDAMALAMMKAETKAKRRVTLSICGLGMMDESELDTIKEVNRADAAGQVVAEAKTAGDRAAELNATIEAEVISPEKGGAGSGTGVENGKPAQDRSQVAPDKGPETASPGPREPSELLHGASSTPPSAPLEGASAPQPATPAGSTAAPSALPTVWKGDDGKLTDEVVQRIEEVLMDGGDPGLAMKFLIFRKKIAEAAPLNTLTIETAKYILTGPAKFHKMVKDWAATPKA